MNNTNERAAPHAAGFIEQPGPGLDRIRELERECEALRAQASALVVVMPEGWRLVEKTTHYQLNDGNTVIACLSGPDAEANATIIARALAAPQQHAQAADRSRSNGNEDSRVTGNAQAALSDAQMVKHAVHRFLGWKLPHNFSPDNGIQFHKPEEKQFWPIGTNLFNADEAKAMFEHCFGGVSAGGIAVKVERNHVWITKGVQSFMLAYEADTEEELNWYAEQLRGMLAAPVAAATQGDAPHGDWPEDYRDVLKSAEEVAYQQGRAAGIEEAAKLADKVGMNRTATDIRALNKGG